MGYVLDDGNTHTRFRWLYLEPILSSDEDELGAKFRKVDQGFRQVTRILEADSRLSALLQSTRLQPMLDSISEQLLACQSALNQYIDEKRSIFPRLYFLSDDDLLELLGQARAGAEGRALVMQTHLKKLFPGTTGVRLGPGDLSVTALCSHHGETFQLDRPVDIDCPVEVWLKNLETEMRSSLKHMTLKCVVTNSLQEQDPFTLPTQILCLAQNIRFTEQAERAITSRDLHKLRNVIEKENSYYASAAAEDESERNKRQALILQCAHYASVVRILIEKNVTSTSDWLWQKQLRFYLMSTKDVVVKMGLAQISYSYEYLGVSTGQFVRTELADDCFLILTQSLHLGLVGNPFGPAGTGKTESVKALGGLLGRLVLVFNCDEAMDAECMGRLLTGLALSGAWGCFDEFNRLSADTLAAVSHQLASLLTALKSKPASGATALLNGKQVVVSEWCGVAATMNPAGRGYGGRRELPAALQRVLRPVAARAPRVTPLAAALLGAAGVAGARALAAPLRAVFTMASFLLSEQRHYDWGLRALKAAVSSVAAALTARAAASPPEQLAVVRRVLALSNVSKLTRHDIPRFEKILSLVFDGVPVEDSSSEPIVKAIEASYDTLKLTHNKLQIKKCVELYEQVQQRMGVVIVGPPGAGKTTVRRLLKNALISQGKNIVEYTICPKAMSRDWLLGNIEPDTRQWTDGVISATALEVSNQPSDVWSWIVCDGDIDPEWVEALNSVLDDNRLLTLPSGWRVQFSANVNFVFETHSLEHASPATVSRMGVILLSEDANCAMDLLNSWTQTVDIENDLAKSAVPLLCQAVRKCVPWFHSHRNDMVLKTNSLTLVKQILAQFEYVAQNIAVSSVRVTAEDIVYEALERSVTGIVKDNAISSLHEELLEILGPPPPPPICAGEWITDCLFMSPRLAICEPILRACLTSDRSHLLIVGPDACAKSLLAEYIIKECNSTMICIDCTPILQPADIITELKRNNAVRSGGQGGVGTGARITLLVRKLHRTHVDAWGSSAVHSFLLQLIEYGGFWSRGGEGGEGGVQWSRVARTRIVATTSSASAVAPRLAAALAHCTHTEPEDDEILELVKTWLKQNADQAIDPKSITTLATTILTMFKEITETFHSRTQYIWNASHLKQWCENVKWHSPKTMEELAMAISAEANMIFRDRLITDTEKSRFKQISRNYLKVNNDDLYLTCKLKGDGVYLESVDYGAWHHSTQKLINQCLSEHEYNVFGDSGAEVCTELAVLCPAVARATNGGVAVIVGSVGVGRRAAALIVAAALPATLHSVYCLSQFNNIFKNALASSAEGSRTLVFVSESAVTSETLAYIEAMRCARSPHAVPAALLPSVQSQHFIQNIKQNLGIVICLDKQQNNLSEMIEKYPMLHNDGHLIWIDRWSESTLKEMPTLVIQRMIKENVTDASEDKKSIPADDFVKIYNSLEDGSMKAPCRYVNFIKSYYNIMNRKKAKLLQRQNMLSCGVEALRRAHSEVATLQAEAAEQEALLSEKQAKANSALDQMSATVRANTDQKEEMHALKRNIELENDNLQIQKKEIEAELASVEPVIAAARAAVGDLRPESLSEVRSLRAPPDVVRDVLEGVLRLMGIADTSWHSMKNFLSKRGVKEDIRCLDASQISPAALQSVQRLLEKRGASFEASTARRASAACAPLAAWVRANVDYARALQRVRPLQASQAALHKNLREAEDQLSALSSGLASVDERVAALKEQLGQHSRDAATIELRLKTAADTLQTAQVLLQQLAHENTQWERDLEDIVKEIAELSQRSLLAAAYIVYLPELTEPQAKEHIKKWGQLIGFDDATFSVINFLSSTDMQLKWEADGLPADQSAVKNAVLIDQVLQTPKCGFTPLLIDPDGEGLLWLRTSLAAAPCDFVSQHSDKLHTAVQYAARLGRILVITDVDEVHESWGGWGRGAARGALVLQCRDVRAARRLPPHARAALSLAHVAARRDELADQLIHYTLQQLTPEISGKSKELKMQKAKLQKQQHELQENLLRDLSSSSDILHDANLIASLKKTRETNATITEALAAAHQIELANREACTKYEVSARRAATLALAVKRLNGRWPLLTLPIDAVLDTFVEAVRKADQSNINHEAIVKHVTRRIIERVLLAVHKKDKYIVVLYLLKHVYEDVMPDKLWQYLIGTSDVSNDVINVREIKKIHSWIPDECLKTTAKLKTIDEDLYSRLSLQNADLWKRFVTSGDLNMLSGLKLSAFENVVCVSALRPDSLYRAIVTFVDQLLGVGALSGSGGVGAAARAARSRPILVLGTHGADALRAHSRHARVQVDVEQGVSAWRAALETARSSGGWLVLSVAASPFTKDLQAFIAEIADSTEHFNEEFRMWILSEYREIPPRVANACLNVILEAPEGVKNNVMGTLSAWGNYEADPKTVRLHAELALFHALVQERRAYIPQGWSRWYAWEWGEITACTDAIRSGGEALCLPLYKARVMQAQDALILAALHQRAPPVPLPTAGSIQTFASALSALSDTDSSEVLALPANCRLAWERRAAAAVLAALRELNTTVSVEEKGDGAASLKSLLALWKKGMAGSPLLKDDDGDEEGGDGWWGCVCGAELRAAREYSRALHAALARARHSHCALTQVPEEWQALWAGPAAPEAYVTELTHRARAALARARRPAPDLPAELDLRDLFQPRRAIWALRAHALSRLRPAPERLVLVGSWAPAERVADGMVVTGLRLSGAEVSESSLRPARAAAPPHAAAPPLALRPRAQSAEAALAPEGAADVPVYDGEARDETLFHVRLALHRDLSRDTAALHAVALFVAPVE